MLPGDVLAQQVDHGVVGVSARHPLPAGDRLKGADLNDVELAHTRDDDAAARQALAFGTQ